MRTLLNKSFSRLTLRSSVDFPQPLGPISAVTLFRGIAIEMSCSACFSPYHRRNCRFRRPALRGQRRRVDLGGDNGSPRAIAGQPICWRISAVGEPRGAVRRFAAARHSRPGDGDLDGRHNCLGTSSTLASYQNWSVTNLRRKRFRSQIAARFSEGDDGNQEQRGREDHGIGRLAIRALESHVVNHDTPDA